MYTAAGMVKFGLSERESDSSVREVIREIKEIARAGGDDPLEIGLGAKIVEAAKRGEPSCKRHVEEALRDGATLEEFRELWDLSLLERGLVEWSENTLRSSMFEYLRQHEGLSEREASRRVRKVFPIYGEPNDNPTSVGDDRPLNAAIRGRIDRYRIAVDAEYHAAQVAKFTTFNAWVRHAIRQGFLPP
jgi:hypothetical protein